MNMPGFTAEVSIDSSKAQYYTRGAIERMVSDAASRAGVVPSMPRVCERLDDCCLTGVQICCHFFEKYCE
jgi:hypothetical protein